MDYWGHARKLDSKGIFAMPGESLDAYVDRGYGIIGDAQFADEFAVVIARQARLGRLYRLRDPAVEYIAGKFAGRFSCDPSWVPLYGFRRTYDPLFSPVVTGGYTSDMISFEQRGMRYDIPPMVFMNLNTWYFERDLSHELVHAARFLSRHPISLYGDILENFEERVANAHPLHRLPLNPFDRANTTYWRGLLALTASFGRAAEYIIIRLPVDELKEFFLEHSLARDPKVTIEKAAHSNIKFKLMQEHLGL